MRTLIACVAAPVLILARPALSISLDLTTPGASGTLNGATYSQVNGLPSGSGPSLGSFLILQNSPTESGYNTGGGLPGDDQAGATFKSDLSVSDFLNNNACILLSLNQDITRNSGQIVLNSLQVYTNPTHNLVTGAGNLGTLQYQIGGGNQVLIDSGLHTSLVPGDMEIDLPSTIFATASPTDAVYVFAQFVGSNNGPETFLLVSDCGDFNTSAGTPPPVPEPLALLTLPLAFAGLYLRKRIAG